MRKFSSYGPINTKLHYHVPRTDLINFAYTQLVGEDPVEGGHYITVWAPRQTGKTWVMQQVVSRLKKSDDFEVAILTLQSAKGETTTRGVLDVLVTNLRYWFQRDFPDVTTWKELNQLFTAQHFSKPLILILDEFDALEEKFINKFANEFRSMHTRRTNEADLKSSKKSSLLHGLALIGVRSVLGIENVSGSPFNVQRSVHIPNLTFAEVEGMFHWYERESGQCVEADVIAQVFAETRGQPGLVSWLGELLTETYNKHNPAITSRDFEIVYSKALNVLPNNNIINIISKAKQEPHKSLVLEMFQTREKLLFRYDDPATNFLYMNGVVDQESVGDTTDYLKFPSPFVQKRLFNYFAHQLFHYVGKLYEPFENLDDTITDEYLHIPNLLRRYAHYLQENRHWLLKDAPRRADLRVREAVYHFNLYTYLVSFLQSRQGQVFPEFPTGNGKIDLIIRYAGQVYGLEVKSYTNNYEYRVALSQAACYGQQLGLNEITLAFFVEAIDAASREQYEAVYHDKDTSVTVRPVFVATG